MTPSLDFKPLIEPLQSHHDWRGFSCGKVVIDSLLRLLPAMQEQRLLRGYVAVEPGHNRVLGAYGVGPHMITPWCAPDEMNALIKQYGLEGIPSALISCFGVSEELQKRGLGTLLFVDALLRISATQGSPMEPRAVIIDPINGEVAKFYGRHGFIPLDSATTIRRMYCPFENLPRPQ